MPAVRAALAAGICASAILACGGDELTPREQDALQAEQWALTTCRSEDILLARFMQPSAQQEAYQADLEDHCEARVSLKRAARLCDFERYSTAWNRLEKHWDDGDWAEDVYRASGCL